MRLHHKGQSSVRREAHTTHRTVISGVFYIGLADQFDGDWLEAYPPGSVVVVPDNTPHYHWAKSGEYVTQVTAIGPLGIEYVGLGDDPSKHT